MNQREGEKILSAHLAARGWKTMFQKKPNGTIGVLITKKTEVIKFDMFSDSFDDKEQSSGEQKLNGLLEHLNEMVQNCDKKLKAKTYELKHGERWMYCRSCSRITLQTRIEVEAEDQKWQCKTCNEVIN